MALLRSSWDWISFQVTWWAVFGTPDQLPKAVVSPPPLNHKSWVDRRTMTVRESPTRVTSRGRPLGRRVRVPCIFWYCWSCSAGGHMAGGVVGLSRRSRSNLAGTVLQCPCCVCQSCGRCRSWVRICRGRSLKASCCNSQTNKCCGPNDIRHPKPVSDAGNVASTVRTPHVHSFAELLS